MRKKFSIALTLFLFSGVFISGISYAKKTSVNALKIYSGYYSREGNNAKMAQTTGNNTYVKFYPGKRIVRLYIPYPYSKTVTPDAINATFNAAVKQSNRSAYIRDKFGVMEQQVVVHLDFFHWVNEQVMFDCDKPTPCKIAFDDHSMTVTKPGLILAHKVNYSLVSE